MKRASSAMPEHPTRGTRERSRSATARGRPSGGHPPPVTLFRRGRGRRSRRPYGRRAGTRGLGCAGSAPPGARGKPMTMGVTNRSAVSCTVAAPCPRCGRGLQPPSWAGLPRGGDHQSAHHALADVVALGQLAEGGAGLAKRPCSRQGRGRAMVGPSPHSTGPKGPQYRPLLDAAPRRARKLASPRGIEPLFPA